MDVERAKEVFALYAALRVAPSAEEKDAIQAKIDALLAATRDSCEPNMVGNAHHGRDEPGK